MLRRNAGAGRRPLVWSLEQPLPKPAPHAAHWRFCSSSRWASRMHATGSIGSPPSGLHAARRAAAHDVVTDGVYLADQKP